MTNFKQFKALRFGIIITFILLVFGIQSTSSLAARSVVGEVSTQDASDEGPFGPALYDEVPPGYSRTLFDVKFLDDSNIQAGGDRVVGLSALDTAALDTVSQAYHVVAVTPVFTAPKDELDRMREHGESMSGKALPDLSTWMRYEIASGDDAEAFMKAMRSLRSVYSVEPAALPSPPPAVTPDFSGNQGYLTPANVGIDALYSWGFAGGDGAGITIFDVEYDWNQTHEDLSKINGLPLLVNAGDSNNSPFANDHGTAVLGEIISDDNGIGVTGISKGASVGLAPTVTTNLGFNPANAINLSAAAAVTGDVILIEQQANVCGLPDGNYGPEEWINTVYSAIETASANGIVVVEAAGNGNVNLDQAACGTTFDRSVRDSGAIIVGAGGTGGTNLERLGFSSYGSRLDLQGWGQNVMTTGYGSFYKNPDDAANPNYFYTSTFNGTSSASPIVAGAVANVQGIAKNLGGVLTPGAIRTLLVQTGTPQQPNESQKIGPRPDLAQALAEIVDPEIDVFPTEFHFEVLMGETDSDIMDIENLGGSNLDWDIDIYTGGTDALGVWTLLFDWGCTGAPGVASLTFNGDFTFADNFGGSGTWSQTDNEIAWEYLVGGDAVYDGYIAGAAMAGTMTATGASGCWETFHFPPGPAPAPAGNRTPSGDLVGNSEAGVTLPLPSLVESVSIGSKAERSSEPQFSAGEIDLTTGSPAVFMPGRLSNREPAATAMGGNVLWDLTHGVYLAYDPDGNYTDLVTQLNSEGFSINTTTAGVENIALSNYDVLVVSVVTAWDSAYTPSEVTAIQNFVNDGGGLVLMCDNFSLGPPNDHVNPVAQAFGTTCGISDLGDPLTDFAEHPILSGVSELDPTVAGEITAGAPTALYAWDSGGKGAISAGTEGGNIVMVGDVNFWDNGNLVKSDNALFASNVFNWVSGSWLSVAPAAGTTLASTTDPVTVGVDTNNYTAGEHGLLVIHSNDGDEATIAVPVSLDVIFEPEIELNPLSFDFTVISGNSDSDILDVGNVGSANLNWSVDWYTGGTDVIGDWTFYYDWGCTGSPGIAIISIFPDFTWMADTGESGPWTLVDNLLVLTYLPNGVTYSGYVAGDHIAGTSFLPPATPGCFEAERVVGPIASLESAELTFTGSPAAVPGEVREFVFDGVDGAKAQGGPWLSATPASGSVPIGNSDLVSVDVDSNDYVAGEYGLLVVHSNDTDEALIAVPVTMAVYEAVAADFSGAPLEGRFPLTVNFTNLSSGDYDSCTWDFGDSSSSNSCANPSHIYTVPGKYSVELSANGLGGNDIETKIDYISVQYWLSLPVIMHIP